MVGWYVLKQQRLYYVCVCSGECSRIEEFWDVRSCHVRSGQVRPGTRDMMSGFCKRNGGERSAGDSDWRMRC
jgi:hypothetical protein